MYILDFYFPRWLYPGCIFCTLGVCWIYTLRAGLSCIYALYTGYILQAPLYIWYILDPYPIHRAYRGCMPYTMGVSWIYVHPGYVLSTLALSWMYILYTGCMLDIYSTCWVYPGYIPYTLDTSCRRPYTFGRSWFLSFSASRVLGVLGLSVSSLLRFSGCRGCRVLGFSRLLEFSASKVRGFCRLLGFSGSGVRAML